MSSDFDFENPYWLRVYEFEQRYYDLDEFDRNQTDDASLSILHRTMERIDLVILLLDQLNVDRFRLKSGRLNRRELAKTLVALIAERNQKRRAGGFSEVHEVGLRAMEITLKELLSQK